MMERYGFAHLHGFASSAQSRKGLLLAEAFAARGVWLQLPDLNRPSFARQTYSDALKVMDELDADLPEGVRWRLSGSSMGGYLAARWAELHPDRVDRLALLCPGFNLGKRWPDLVGRDRFAQWEREGTLLFSDATGKEVPVHWGLIEDFSRHPACPDVCCPTLIIHGIRDEVVPIETSRTYAADRPGLVKLIPVDDNHYLMQSLNRIQEEILDFFELKA
ncbi:MAG: YqiA/YcfP family alpha/beta fold hydrolase [Planctomycetota bacterium]